MSEIDTLAYIRGYGTETFLDRERARSNSGTGILCVRDRKQYPIGGGAGLPPK